MKKFILILCLLGMLGAKAQNIKEYRQLMVEAKDDGDKAEELNQKSTKDYQKTKNPMWLAFTGVSNLFLAKNSYNPINKISFFKKGKKQLDSAIAKDPDNVEMRLMRYAAQQESPSVLGYNKNLTEDKKFLQNHVASVKDKDLQKEIKRRLNK